MEFLVLGTGRCGTTYMSKLITTAGKTCGHESIFTVQGITHSNLCGDSSWLAVPYLNTLDLSNLKLVHLVRNPLKVFRSWFYDQNNTISLNPNPVNNIYSEYLLKHYPKVAQLNNSVDRAIMYYLTCNNIILNISTKCDYLLFKVEDHPKVVLNFLDVNTKVSYKHLMYSNSRDKKIATEEDVLPILKQSAYYEELVTMFLYFYPELKDKYEF